MSAQVAKANMIDAMKKLRMRWNDIRNRWQDDAALKFEREVIDPLEPAILQACRGMEHVGELMHQVRRDCGDDGGGE